MYLVKIWWLARAIPFQVHPIKIWGDGSLRPVTDRYVTVVQYKMIDFNTVTINTQIFNNSLFNLFYDLYFIFLFFTCFIFVHDALHGLIDTKRKFQ